MRTIKYQRHEFHEEKPEDREAPLFLIVYDVPYFGACGICPSFHITNQFFASGGSRGHESRRYLGTFHYYRSRVLRACLGNENLAPETLGDAARYKWCKFEFDCSFDNLSDLIAWVQAVCNKHRETYREKIAMFDNLK